jgi:hypothetical protein
MNYNLVGVIFLLYGIIKILMVTSLFFIPPEIKKRMATIEGLDMFVSGDETVSGKMYEYVLLTFAIFSVIHGLALLGVFPEGVHNLIERKAFQYPFYIALGLWLMIFYAIVLYTNLPIEKDMKNARNYKIYCYFGGLSFLLVPVVWELIEKFNPKLNQMPQDKQLMYMTLLMLAAIFVIFLVYIVTKRLYSMYVRDRKAGTVKKDEKPQK